MSTFITIFIAFANIIAILLVYYSLGRKMDKQKKLFPIMISLGVVYIITLVTFLLSSIGIEKTVAAETAKNVIIMSFVPVNTILFVPFLISSYLKAQNKVITMEKLNRRVIILGILAAIVVVCEFFYFRGYQKDLKSLENKIKNLQAISENTITEYENNDIESNNETINNINNEMEGNNETMNNTNQVENSNETTNSTDNEI